MVRYLSGLYDVVRVEGRAYSVYRKPQRERERERRACWETKGEEEVEWRTYTKAEGRWTNPRKRIGVRRVKHHRQDYNGVSPVSRCFIAMTSPGFSPTAESRGWPPVRVENRAKLWNNTVRRGVALFPPALYPHHEEHDYP